MKITINAFGSRGDVQPFVALGKGLRAAGFEVLITTHKVFEKLTQENGLDYFPIDANPHDVLVSQAVVDIGNNPVKISRWMEYTLGVSQILKIQWNLWTISSK